MKKLLTFICLLLTTACCQAQLFNYRHSDKSVVVAPLFEHDVLKGKKSGYLVVDSQEKFRQEANSVAQKFLSKTVVDYLAQKTGYMYIKAYVSPSGYILYATFVIHKELFDQNLITEEQLKGMYDSYKQIEIDVSKFNAKENFDFCLMTFPVYRPKRNKF